MRRRGPPTGRRARRRSEPPGAQCQPGQALAGGLRRACRRPRRDGDVQGDLGCRCLAAGPGCPPRNDRGRADPSSSPMERSSASEPTLGERRRSARRSASRRRAAAWRKSRPTGDPCPAPELSTRADLLYAPRIYAMPRKRVDDERLLPLQCGANVGARGGQRSLIHSHMVQAAPLPWRAVRQRGPPRPPGAAGGE